jgi:uncharacterized protein YbjT (DUF2867 family)
MKQETVLVVGASGTVGSELSRLLKEQGYLVRATTSQSVASMTTDKVHINLATGEGIKSAMEGVDRAFILSPPGYADQYAMLSPLIQEAKRKGLKKVVLMTAMGANAVETSPFRRAEIELEKSGISYNIIRPNWFMQNFNSFWIQGILSANKILLPAGQAKVGFIDARDISAVAAKLLTTETHNNQAFDITGPESLDHNQVAAAIAKVTKKSITYEDIKPEVLHAGLLSGGVPNDYADFLLMILGFLREGYSASVNDNVRLLLGRQPNNLEKYVTDYQKSWM